LAFFEEFDLVGQEKDRLALLILSLKYTARALTGALIDLEGVTFQGGKCAAHLFQGLYEVGLFLAALPCPGEKHDHGKCNCSHAEPPSIIPLHDLQSRRRYDNRPGKHFHQCSAFSWTLPAASVSLALLTNEFPIFITRREHHAEQANR